MQASVFRPYSLGIAGENLKLGSHTLEVVPVEVVGMVDGELTSEMSELLDKGVDGEDIEYTVKVKASITIKAQWMPFGSNRQTPPNVRRGERVELYRVADSDQFYWRTLGLDDGLRRLETVVFAFSNTRDESVKRLTPDNSYYMEISTHTKQITLKTNKSDGEPFAYTLQVNTKAGAVTIADDYGNFFEMDSKERRLQLKNRDGSHYDMHKKSLFLTIPETVHQKCKDWIVEASNSITHRTTTMNYESVTWSADMSGSITFNTPTFNGNIGASTFNGTVGIAGLTTMQSGWAIAPLAGGPASAGAGTSSMDINIQMNLNGSNIVITGGTVFIDGVDCGPLHKHTGNLGAPTSPIVP